MFILCLNEFMKNKVLFCILDGFGYGPDYEGNAIRRANTPFLDELWANHPWTLLDASGESVGIPAGTQGGSEVGHLTMGAGRIVLQPLQMIDKSIETGEFFRKEELLEAANYAKENNVNFHILGMVSDQGIHADIDHAHALLKFAKDQGVEKVYVHGITDGRDVPPKSAAPFVESLKSDLATLIGRFYAMDRDSNLERTQKAYDLFVNGVGEKAEDGVAAIQAAYDAGLESDYYLEPILLKEEGLIKAKDVVVFYNFRTDRAQQLTEKLIDELGVKMVVFGAYTDKAPNVFPPQSVEQNIGSIVAGHGLKQLRIAETEKFPHVTFFFNSQDKEAYEGEDRIVVKSPKVASYKDSPEMSADEITEKLLTAMDKDYSFIVLNFANLDLVGHSGNYEATVKAVEKIDECLQKIVGKGLESGFTTLITGDHGNAEYMKYEDGSDCPSHTRNPVPLIAVSNEELKFKNPSHEKAAGGLQDIAPTILHLMGYPKPEVMTGQDLLA